MGGGRDDGNGVVDNDDDDDDGDDDDAVVVDNASPSTPPPFPFAKIILLGVGETRIGFLNELIVLHLFSCCGGKILIKSLNLGI